MLFRSAGKYIVFASFSGVVEQVDRFRIHLSLTGVSPSLWTSFSMAYKHDQIQSHTHQLISILIIIMSREQLSKLPLRAWCLMISQCHWPSLREL